MFACGSVVASLASAHSPQAVEHAPTVEQCQADAILWSTQAQDFYEADKDHNAQNSTVANLTAKELFARGMEMRDCLTTDSTRSKNYTATATTYIELFSERVNSFMRRHNLMDQFFAEDAAGER
jgi:hypothetical protein